MLLEGRLVRLQREHKQRGLKRGVKMLNVTTPPKVYPCLKLQTEFLTIYRSAGLINQAVPFNDAVGLLGLPPGHVDRSCCQLAEVDEAGGAGGFWRKKEVEGRVGMCKTSRIHEGICKFSERSLGFCH